MKIVITDYEFPSLDPERDALKGLPAYELVEAKCTTPEECAAACRYADGVLNQWNHLTADVINAMENCKAIATYGIGVDKIDVDAATAKGIYVCNSPNYNKFEVSNHACAMIMALSRQLIQSDRLMRQDKYGWMYLENELHRPNLQTLGFIGFGNIAKQIAQKMSAAFQMEIIAYDPFLTAEQIEAAGGKKAELEDVMRKSDFVSINVSLTKDTYHLITKKELEMMKPTAYIVNCSRGAIIDEHDLYEALRDRKIYGAALDVFETEPIPSTHELMQLDNVIFTPHSAWHTRESMWEMQWGAADQIAKVLAGEEPDHCVNYEAVKKVLGK